jgi:hypothetical protein
VFERLRPFGCVVPTNYDGKGKVVLCQPLFLIFFAVVGEIYQFQAVILLLCNELKNIKKILL